MLQEGISVGHACNVVGDDPGSSEGAVAGLGAPGGVAVLVGEQGDILHQHFEEFVDDPAGLRRHSQHAVVVIDALAQELL